MREAIALSVQKMQDGQGGPFGAVVVKDGKVIGRGWNKVTSSNDPTAHAEVEAIREACKNLGTNELKDCILYTSCEPCPMCLSAIYWSRLPRFFYGNSRSDAAAISFDDDLIYREIPMSVEKRKIPGTQLLSTEARKAFEIWDKDPSKKRY